MRGQLRDDVLGILTYTAEQRRADPVLAPQSNEAKAWRGGLLGHSIRSIFERYNIVNERDLMEAGQRLGQYIDRQAGKRRSRRLQASVASFLLRPVAVFTATRLLTTTRNPSTRPV